MVTDDRPAPGCQDSPDPRDRLPGVPHQEGDVAQLRHAGQELQVLSTHYVELSSSSSNDLRGFLKIEAYDC